MILIIGEKEYIGLTDYTITQKYNSVASTFTFNLPKNILDYILEYPICELRTEENKRLLTGRIFIPSKNTTAKPLSVTYNGYSLPGVLEDCPIPIDIYPLQFDKLSLLDITDKVLQPFGINYTFIGDLLSDLSKSYKKITAEPSQTVKEFLNNLASQRNIYLSNDTSGQLVYTRYDSKKFLPTTYYQEGSPGLKEVKLSLGSQQMHSAITILKQATKESPDNAQTTIENPYIESYRPTTIISNSGDNFDIEKAARNALSAELRNIKFTLKTTQYAEPGTTIELLAPSQDLNKSTELFVEQTTIQGTAKNTELYTLECVLPDVYQDGDVKNVFK